MAQMRLWVLACTLFSIAVAQPMQQWQRNVAPQLLRQWQGNTQQNMAERRRFGQQLAETCPNLANTMLWKVDRGALGPLYLLGTVHSKILPRVNHACETIRWLLRTTFASVHVELDDGQAAAVIPSVMRAAVNIRQGGRSPEEVLCEAYRILASSEKRDKVQHTHADSLLRMSGTNAGLDSSYAAFALHPQNVNPQSLETQQTRALAGNNADRLNRQLQDMEESAIASGSLQSICIARAGFASSLGASAQGVNSLAQGIDMQDVEARNLQWLALPALSNANAGLMPSLWIVGSSHLPGLIVRLRGVPGIISVTPMTPQQIPQLGRTNSDKTSTSEQTTHRRGSQQDL
jgi:hypothetical protein